MERKMSQTRTWAKTRTITRKKSKLIKNKTRRAKECKKLSYLVAYLSQRTL